MSLHRNSVSEHHTEQTQFANNYNHHDFESDVGVPMRLMVLQQKQQQHERSRSKRFGVGVLFGVTIVALVAALIMFQVNHMWAMPVEPSSHELRITVIVHAQLQGQLPKAMELFSCTDIPDLSVYTIQTYFNGANVTTSKFTFPTGSSAVAGQYIYVATEKDFFYDFFGFYPDYVARVAVDYNGNDVPTLWKNGIMVDIYGEIGVDGSGTPWDYKAGWAARISGKDASPTFHVSDWKIRKEALIGSNSTNVEATQPVPIKTFQCTGVPTIVITHHVSTTLSLDSIAPSMTPTSSSVYPSKPTTTPTPQVAATASPTSNPGSAGILVKVMSYNIDNSGVNPAWMDVVKEENPDIAVFVEVGSWDDNNNQLLNQHVSQFNSYFNANKPYQGSVSQNTKVNNTGCALMSRYPIINTVQLDTLTLRNGTIFRPAHPLMVWNIMINGRLIYVCGFYNKCCKGNDDTRERTMEGFINYLDGLGEVPLFIMGDFNAVSPSDADPSNPDYNEAFRPAPASNVGYGPLTMLLYPNDPTYGRYSSRGVHNFTDTFRKVNYACGVSGGNCCYLKAMQCAYLDGSTCIERGYTYHNGLVDSRIDFIIANQFIQVTGPSTVGDTASACAGSDHFAVDNHFLL